jgi:hypothetical protein
MDTHYEVQVYQGRAEEWFSLRRYKLLEDAVSHFNLIKDAARILAVTCENGLSNESTEKIVHLNEAAKAVPFSVFWG